MTDVKFFNFVNQQTYHFFRWIGKDGANKAEALIAEAMGQVEGDPWFEMDLDVSTVARDKLAALLDDVLDGILADAGIDGAYDTLDIGIVGPEPLNLTGPLVALAFREVSTRAVAEALLIQAKKWAPDTDFPEMR